MDIVKFEYLGLGYHAQLRNSEDRQGKVSENGRGWLQVQEFWEFAQKCMCRLVARGLPLGAIVETTLFEWLREF